jgi:cytochrome c peroxidase
VVRARRERDPDVGAPRDALIEVERCRAVRAADAPPARRSVPEAAGPSIRLAEHADDVVQRILIIGLVACSHSTSAITSQDAAPDGAPGDAPQLIDGSTPSDAPATPMGSARDSTGYGDSVFANGYQPDSPFFAALGTNGRSCATCHAQATGWSITPAFVQARFDATNGTDPLFRLVDGATSPNADVSTLAAKQAAYSMLLNKAVIRIGLAMPAGAEFTLAAVNDPYGYASASELSLFRRPLPATNLTFLATIMWDGREPSLASQAHDATMGHEQAVSADPTVMAQIVAFESAITTAQVVDDAAGALDGSGATGGTAALASQSYTAGENDPFANQTPTAFALYDAWAGAANAQRASIARGQAIFNTRTIFITGVAGVNDATGQADYEGTCASCHDATNAGNLSIAAPVDIGVSTQTPTPDEPVYTFARTSDGTTIQTTDPGMALVTGKWADMNKFAVPVLRALAMRPPYFHDGSAQTLADVVTYYNNRFDIGLTTQDQADLVAFLQSL